MDRYKVTGMSCAACSARVEKAVSKVEGVDCCSVNLLTNSMTVEGSAASQSIIDAVKAAGYGASLENEKKANGQDAASDEKEKNPEARALVMRLISSAVFLCALMYISMGHMMWGFPLPSFFEQNPTATALAQLVLSTVVLVINQRFFISGAKGLMHGAPNMDTLVALGSGVSYLYSLYTLFLMCSESDPSVLMSYLHGLYFESAAMILTLITVGKLLESHSKGKTTNALKALMKLSPKSAILLRDGTEVSVPIDEVRKGDIFVVKAGESVPADGVVIEGNGAVDESSLTGESIPVDKEKSDAVYAATVNRNGYLICEATKVGEDTALSQIIKMVSDASATKAPSAKIADKVSGIFVPFVITVALITTAVWLISGESLGFSLARGISVLVISCPCALGLATPVAIMVGSGKGASNGILFKNATSLEQTGKTQIAAVDKTGTLTLGQPTVTDIIANGVTDNELLTYAYTLEKKSEHPLAWAVVKYAQEHNITAKESESFKVLSGNGLSAQIDGKSFFGGSMKYIGGIVDIDEKNQKTADALAEEGKTPLFFSDGTKLYGIIAVADKIKEESKHAVAELRSMGIKVVMLTGDNEKTARAVARQIGVDSVMAGILPDGKEKAIRELKAHGKVLMVGDGINDAPALTCADTGVAIGAGTQIAIDSADVVLVNSNPADIAAAIKLSRHTIRNIHQNLFWAFFYNMIGIPLAAGVFIPLFGWELNPMFGAAAMSLSSFCVVTNALRLNLVKLHKNNKSSQGKDAKAKNTFTVTGENKMEKTMKIEGMMCPHCEARVKQTLEALSEVESAEVSHKSGTAVVTLSADISDEKLSEAVTAQGYKVTECK